MGKILSIIIVTYRSQLLINPCLDSIINNCDINNNQLEVIVVDNSSDNDAKETEQFVRDHKIAQVVDVRYIKNTANLGYGHGNNVGIKNSSGRIICIMNPDVNFVTSVFEKVINHFNRNATLAMLGGKQIGYRDLSFYFLPEKAFPVITDPLCLFLNKINAFIRKHMFLSGALLFIERGKFESIGFFDESIFMYKEESDITTRFQKEKYNIIYDRKIKYRHLIEGREKWAKNRTESSFTSLKYYCNKHNHDLRRILKRYILSLKLKGVAFKLFGSKEQFHSNREYIEFYKTKYSSI